MARTKHYVVPFGLFLVLTELSRFYPNQTFVLYTLKTLLVGGLLWFWRHHYQELSKPLSLKGALGATISGLLVFVFWIGGENFWPKAGTPSNISPFSQDFSDGIIFLTILVRIIGAVLVVPLMEELFWRSFLMRFLIRKDFQKVPLGTYTHFSFWSVTLLFALEHFRVVPGFVAGIVYGALLCLSRNLRVPILGHAVTNLALSLYVLKYQKWLFW